MKIRSAVQVGIMSALFSSPAPASRYSTAAKVITSRRKFIDPSRPSRFSFSGFVFWRLLGPDTTLPRRQWVARSRRSGLTQPLPNQASCFLLLSMIIHRTIIENTYRMKPIPARLKATKPSSRLGPWPMYSIRPKAVKKRKIVPSRSPQTICFSVTRLISLCLERRSGNAAFATAALCVFAPCDD